MVDGRIFEYQTFKAFAGFDPGTLHPETDKNNTTSIITTLLAQIFLFSRLSHTEQKGEKNTKENLNSNLK